VNRASAQPACETIGSKQWAANKHAVAVGILLIIRIHPEETRALARCKLAGRKAKGRETAARV